MRCSCNATVRGLPDRYTQCPRTHIEGTYYMDGKTLKAASVSNSNSCTYVLVFFCLHVFKFYQLFMLVPTFHYISKVYSYFAAMHEFCIALV